MNNTITFKDGQYPRQLTWNDISFDLNCAVRDTLFSEKVEDGYITHLVYGQYGDQWKYYCCIVSTHPNGSVIVSFVTDNEMIDMCQNCAYIEIMENRYRPPMNGRYASDFPTIEQVYQYDDEQFEQFNQLYFGNQF